MSGFHRQEFQHRFGAMGDEAEGWFEKVWPNAWVRYGFNRPRCSMKRWSLRTRYTPDYMDRYGPIECQGFGGDRVLKIKDEKREAMGLWFQDEPHLRFFIWDTTTQSWTYCNWQVVDNLLSTPHMRGAFPEGTPYGGIHFDQIADLEWHTV